MITCVRKIRILLLKVEECPDFAILQSNYPYVAPMEELASTLKVWIFPNFCHFPWIFASRQRNAPGFSGIFAYIRIFSSIGGGVRILTGTTLADIANSHVPQVGLPTGKGICFTLAVSRYCKKSCVSSRSLLVHAHCSKNTPSILDFLL